MKEVNYPTESDTETESVSDVSMIDGDKDCKLNQTLTQPETVTNEVQPSKKSKKERKPARRAPKQISKRKGGEAALPAKSSGASSAESLDAVAEKSSLDSLSVGKTFPCPHCPKSYESSRALGGHTSKQHKGMSQAYTRKIEVRAKREAARAALKIAKVVFSKFSSANMIKQRAQITIVRNVILKTREGDLKKENPEIQVDSWYRSLALELQTGVHGKEAYYRKVFTFQPEL